VVFFCGEPDQRLAAQQRGQAAGRESSGVVSLVAELRGHEQQTAEELEQWKTRVEEH
jgi:hypothetical protein